MQSDYQVIGDRIMKEKLISDGSRQMFIAEMFISTSLYYKLVSKNLIVTWLDG